MGLNNLAIIICKDGGIVSIVAEGNYEELEDKLEVYSRIANGIQLKLEKVELGELNTFRDDPKALNSRYANSF